MDQVKGKDIVVHAYNGIILSNKKELLINTEIWVDLKGYTECEINLYQKIYVVCFHLYDILGYNKTIVSKIDEVIFNE